MRQSTGIADLDERLGGGLLPGTLTVLVGATGIGKTQLGLQFARAGLDAEGRSGIIFDVSARGDDQNHARYAARLFGWSLRAAANDRNPDLASLFNGSAPGDYLHVFDYRGHRVSRQEMDGDAWHQWQAELNAKLHMAIGFLYGNLVRGTRRVVVDGIEPVERPTDSIQLQLFEYLYHQVLRKEPTWVARELFRQHYRENAQRVAEHVYDPGAVGCLLLYTAQEQMLEDLMARPLSEGDLLAGANTVIYLGKIRDGRRMARALYIAKHRGSACSDEIVPFTIDDAGLRIEAGGPSLESG